MIIYSIHEFQKDCDRLIQKQYPYLRMIMRQKGNPFHTQSKLNVWRRSYSVFELNDIGAGEADSIESFVKQADLLWGIEVTVLRRMRNTWLPVKHTGHLSFEQQNKIGLEMALSEML
ncbi:hypothetical protein [Gynurincola endophyticus]|uniref:hypothetical protein n=1 Tax=Gynurincola endophyticus TaxID=2479004 RepID=UPI000F8CA5E6|nr:hypothetical protein [Gynurincola endophyticus]